MPQRGNWRTGPVYFRALLPPSTAPPPEMAPSVLSYGLTDQDCPHNRVRPDPASYPRGHEGRQGQGPAPGQAAQAQPSPGSAPRIAGAQRRIQHRRGGRPVRRRPLHRLPRYRTPTHRCQGRLRGSNIETLTPDRAGVPHPTAPREAGGQQRQARSERPSRVSFTGTARICPDERKQPGPTRVQALGHGEASVCDVDLDLARRPGAGRAGARVCSNIRPACWPLGKCCGIVMECCAGCVNGGRRRVSRSASAGIRSTCGSWVSRSVGAVSRSARLPACTAHDAGT